MYIYIRVQVLESLNAFSQNIYTLGKGMNPTILPPAMSK